METHTPGTQPTRVQRITTWAKAHPRASAAIVGGTLIVGLMSAAADTDEPTTTETAAAADTTTTEAPATTAAPTTTTQPTTTTAAISKWDDWVDNNGGDVVGSYLAVEAARLSSMKNVTSNAELMAECSRGSDAYEHAAEGELLMAAFLFPGDTDKLAELIDTLGTAYARCAAGQFAAATESMNQVGDLLTWFNDTEVPRLKTETV